ncbi:hypothetical protein FG386_002007 [Cryptosporidium ryanae]|uniref:uncharacterized protein n=1 Tax=Cryptosporidium ryanae TaxID=515981 RepID=UPI00351A8BD7|nr:hypothetical protein FG386_002007 [Cryptosporidium ryanae]
MVITPSFVERNNARLKLLFVILLLQTVFLFVSGDRYKELLKLKEESKNGVITFNFTGYQHYVLSDRREYDLVILYTGTLRACPTCHKSTSNFELVASNYYNQMGPRPNIFFGFIYVDKVENVVSIHRLRFLPAIIYINSGKEFLSNALTFKRENQWRIPEQKDLSPRAMINFVNSRSGNSYEIILTFEEKVKRIATLLFFVIVILAILYLLLTMAINKPFIIMILSVVVCSFSMSGLVYSIQHGKLQSGDFFARNPRIQNLNEGLLMSILMTASSLTLFIAPFILHGKLSIFNKKVPYWTTSILIGIFVSMIYFIYFGYKLKVAWYSPSFYPPHGYQKGPLLVDRGNSF